MNESTLLSHNVRLLKEPEESRKTAVKLSRDLGLISEQVTSENVPDEVLACKLPVWFLPQQRTCIAGEAYKLEEETI